MESWWKTVFGQLQIFMIVIPAKTCAARMESIIQVPSRSTGRSPSISFLGL